MKRLILSVLILITIVSKIAAQQNWAAIPCTKMRGDVDQVNKMMVDSLHNEIILHSVEGSTICNTVYKGMFAYNGFGFHDLDKGIETHNPNPFTAGGGLLWGCTTFNNKTLFGGYFRSVGTNTLLSKGLALWNGAVWDTFPTHCFSNKLNYSGGGFYGFLKYNGKLWMYGGFDTVGNTITKNIAAYDGYTFSAVPSIPVNDYLPITKMIVYKNKLIATGNFDDYPLSPNMCRLAQFDGTSWASVGNGVQGALSGVWDFAVYNDTLYIAGSFPKSAGNAGNYIMKWDGNQLYDAGFGDYCGWQAIYNLIPFKNRLYAFGGFLCAADQKAFGVAYYENGKWTVPQDSIENWGINSAVLYNDAIYIGGGFKSINGDTSIHQFAKLICPDFDAASGCASGLKESSDAMNLKVFPNPPKDKLYIEFEKNTVINKLTISNALGQQMFKLANPAPRQEVDVSQLPAGIYFFTAEGQKGQSVFKIVKE